MANGTMREPGIELRGSLLQADITKPFREFGLARFFFLLYMCAMFAHQKGEGLDALIVRGTFVAYVAVSFFTTFYISVKRGETGRLFTCFYAWLLLFWLWAFLSFFWASSASFFFYQAYINNIVQLLVVVPLLLLQTRNRDDVILLLKIFLLANLYSDALLFAGTPSSAWGTERVGAAIGVQFNSLGMRNAIAAFIALFLFTEKKNPLYLLCIIPFATVSFFSGSRKAFFILFMATALYLVFVYKGIRAFRNTLIVVAVLIGAYALVMTNQDLYYILGRRIENLSSYFLEGTTAEHSALERAFYREYALGMWANSPIVGWGFNQFAAQMHAINYSHVAYSHCNYTELLACLGIVGFALYYWIYIYLCKGLLRGFFKKRDPLTLFALVFLVILAVSEYGFVAYVDIDEYLYLLICFAALRVCGQQAFRQGAAI